ncbi:NUDIX hydrolase domain-like protein [Dactylonectria macrodidyma]|uniref:NUDIX hydrolase domain-like protein n=1 Tax=Dactylonectria macrodidyma TaxID=307937 RepID=A0A9P9I5U6_9HYPO|nr:NUDIX hydrolase domain-like protein [Dactylonectria macrodidyma]
MRQRMGTMGILIRRGDTPRGGEIEVLLIQRRFKNQEILENGPPDSWAFPGGAVDAGETPEMAVVREFKEEVGIDVVIEPIGDEPVWGETDDELKEKILRKWWRCFLYLVKQVDPTQEPEVKEPHKHVDVMWMTWTELWERINASISSGDEPCTPEGMRFFVTLENIVKKYPNRSDPASLERRV